MTARNEESRTIVRDRVKELRRVRASDLVPNPRNWREHPDIQRRALESLLAEIGYADALLAREDEQSGKIMLIDGHLRAETTPDALVPVLILDVTPEEADKLLVTLDPLAAMAKTNEDRLAEILRDVGRPIEFDAPMVTVPDTFKEFDESVANDVMYLKCPSCGHTWPK